LAILCGQTVFEACCGLLSDQAARTVMSGLTFRVLMLAGCDSNDESCHPIVRGIPGSFLPIVMNDFVTNFSNKTFISIRYPSFPPAHDCEGRDRPYSRRFFRNIQSGFRRVGGSP